MTKSKSQKIITEVYFTNKSGETIYRFNVDLLKKDLQVRAVSYMKDGDKVIRKSYLLKEVK